MQEVGGVLEGGLLALDVVEEGFELPDLVGARRLGGPGLLEVAKEGAFLNLQGSQAEAEGVGSGFADFGDFLFEEVESFLGPGDLSSQGLGFVEFRGHGGISEDSYQA